MENINIQNTSFAYKNMIPEVGDELSTLWGRKLVNNLFLGYACIGTIRLDTTDLVYINLRLTQKYLFPPAITIYYRSSEYNGLEHNDFYIPFDGTPSIQVSDTIYYRKIETVILGDFLGFRANLGTSQYVDCYFKLHGV